jgi:hypothetical protein
MQAQASFCIWPGASTNVLDTISQFDQPSSTTRHGCIAILAAGLLKYDRRCACVSAGGAAAALWRLMEERTGLDIMRHQRTGLSHLHLNRFPATSARAWRQAG